VNGNSRESVFSSFIGDSDASPVAFIDWVRALALGLSPAEDQTY
jgi:hypothetical protein